MVLIITVITILLIMPVTLSLRLPKNVPMMQGEIKMNSIQSNKQDRILSEEYRSNVHKILESVRYGFVGAILAFSLFAILSIFDMGDVTVSFGSTLIDPEGVWAFLGGVAGLIIGLTIEIVTKK